MSRTANLRRQHDAAVALVGEIVALSARLDEEGVPYRLSLMLAKLTGLLRIHFAQEDKTLYPHMIRSTHAEAAQTAIDFQDEMGGLSAQYEVFATRWSSASALAAMSNRFRVESEELFTALGQRIERENARLYPLADAIEDWQIARTA